MNRELGLKAIVRRKKFRGSALNGADFNFPDLIKRDFSAVNINKKWCTDFTCLTLANGEKHYNCTIIDLFDRSVVASITDKNITAYFFCLSVLLCKKYYLLIHDFHNLNFHPKVLLTAPSKYLSILIYGTILALSNFIFN